MSEKMDQLRDEASKALANKEAMDQLLEDLEGPSRRKRQHAASVLDFAAHTDAPKMQPYIGDLVDALDRPEAQTRWECLEALAVMVDVDSRSCDRAFDGAETALFDEDNGLLRLAAVRFLCKWGSTTEKRSEKVWPLIDETIQCYHGDPEFNEMLNAINEFSQGKLSQSVKEQLRLRLSFDAENGKGSMKTRAAQILANLS
ncbi:MAG: HEAT repeat domain-containing protein [Eggerthellaceae bacterium]